MGACKKRMEAGNDPRTPPVVIALAEDQQRYLVPLLMGKGKRRSIDTRALFS